MATTSILDHRAFLGEKLHIDFGISAPGDDPAVVVVVAASQFDEGSARLAALLREEAPAASALPVIRVWVDVPLVEEGGGEKEESWAPLRRAGWVVVAEKERALLAARHFEVDELPTVIGLSRASGKHLSSSSSSWSHGTDDATSRQASYRG